MPRILAALCTLLLLLSVSVASAETAPTQAPTQAPVPEKLTEGAIRQFYQDSIAVLRKPAAEYLAYIRKTINDGFTGTMTVNTAQKMTMTKKDMLDNALQTQESARNAQVSVQIDGMQIEPDGQSAFVRTRTRSTGLAIPLPGGKGTVMVDVNHVCNDYVILQPGAGIQAMQSECEQTVIPAR